MSREQHLLLDTTRLADLVRQAGLRGRRVLEVGAGTGAVTRCVLSADPERLVAYEIEPGLCELRDPRLDLREVDFLSGVAAGEPRPAARSFQEFRGWALVSAPPYSLLPALRVLVDGLDLDPVILMIPPRLRSAFSGFTVHHELRGDAFSPPSKGAHLVVYRGF